MKSIFLTIDYKHYLKSHFQSPENRGLMSEAAIVLECGKSYLSRVLNEKMDLSLDQGFRLSQFLQHSPSEREYFALCINHARALSKEYKTHLREQINSAKEKHETSLKKGSAPIIEMEASHLEYYAHWWIIPLHLMTSFNDGISIKEASIKLRLSEELVKTSFDYLINRSLITQKSNRFHFKTGAQYLPPRHPLLSILHRLIREQSLLYSQTIKPNSVQYSIWQTLSIKDYEKVKDILVNSIDRINRLSQPSHSEKIFGLSIDLFDPF